MNLDSSHDRHKIWNSSRLKIRILDGSKTMSWSCRIPWTIYLDISISRYLNISISRYLNISISQYLKSQNLKISKSQYLKISKSQYLNISISIADFSNGHKLSWVLCILIRFKGGVSFGQVVFDNQINRRTDDKVVKLAKISLFEPSW